MAEYRVTDTELKQVADAIRQITESTNNLKWNEDYISKILSFNEVVTTLREQVTTLQNMVTQLNAQIQTLQTENQNLQNLIATLNSQIEELEEEIADLEDIIADLQAQIEELEKSFEIVTVTSSEITSFTILKDTLEKLENKRKGYVMYISKAIYEADNSIICFPLANGEFTSGAYCYRNSLAEGPHFYSLNYDDHRKFKIPAYAKMLRVVLDYEIQ